MMRSIFLAATVCCWAASSALAQVPPAPTETPTRPLTYTTSWIGNTFGGGKNWVQNFCEGMYVAPDGTVYLASGWDEGGREFGIYRDGKVIGQAEGTHGWGTGGGRAVVATDKYLFIGHSQGNEGGGLVGPQYPPKGKTWFGISRYTLDGKPAPFAGGGGRFGAFLRLSEVEDGKNAQVQHLSASPDGKNFFVVAPDILFFARDTETMREAALPPVPPPSQFSLPSASLPSVSSLPLSTAVVDVPSRKAFWDVGMQVPDEAGGFWQIVGTPMSGVAPYRIVNTRTGQFLFGTEGDVTCLAFDPWRKRLFVGIGAERQQVLIYDVAGKNPRLIHTVGERGGILAGPVAGKNGPLRFAGITGVGVDRAGNLYVGCNQAAGGTVLRSFSPAPPLPPGGRGGRGVRDTYRPRWELLGLEFVDTADAAPGSDGQDVYTTENRYTVDWSKPVGKQWTWRAQTLDPDRYPGDPRLHEGHHDMCAPLVREFGGRRYLVVRGMFETACVFYRLDKTGKTEIAVPSTMLSKGPFEPKQWPAPQPDSRFIWRDRNGNGHFDKDEFADADGTKEPESWAWWVDTDGGVWQGQQDGDKPLRYFPSQGMDAHGNPIYTRASMKSWDLPAPLNHLLRIEYDPTTDTLYLTGHSRERPKTGAEWGQVGSELVRYDNFLKGGNCTPKWRAAIPYHPEAGQSSGGITVAQAAQKSFCTAGDYAFTVDTRTAQVNVFRLADGVPVGHLTPGPEVARESGWVDFPDAIRATRRRSGEYLVFVEEDGKGKVLVYRWIPDRDANVALTHPALREELLAMEKTDQDARNQWIKAGMPVAGATAKAFSATDAAHLPRIKAIVREHGFPTRAMVGREGVDAAFLLIQHADRDPAFQKVCLPLVKAAFDRGEMMDGQDVALLTDRTLRADGKPQLYGTQFRRTPEGEWLPQSIADPMRVDARRKQMGLMPLAEYARILRRIYAAPLKTHAGKVKQ